MKAKIIILIIVVVTIFSGCKKGINDPFISLKCRKSRVVGEWTATSVKSTSTNTSNNLTTTSTYTYGNGTWTVTNSGSNYSGIGSYEVVFSKDGTYVMTKTEDDLRTVTEGTWNFSGKIGDDKNKDHIILKTTKQTQTDGNSTSVESYDTNEYDGAYYLDELGGKKMVWTIKSTDSNSYTITGFPTTTSSGTFDQEYIWEIK